MRFNTKIFKIILKPLVDGILNNNKYLNALR